MTSYRKRPVVIEAFQLDHEGQELLPRWAKDAVDAGQMYWSGSYWTIKTLEGPLRASPSDWIIKGTSGELYPRKPDIFATIYEPVE